MPKPSVSGLRPILPGEGEPFTDEDRPDTETNDRHAGEGAPIAVFAAPVHIHRCGSGKQKGRPRDRPDLLM
jgi:hypothetical protein